MSKSRICPRCNQLTGNAKVRPVQRILIRAFMKKYPWVKQSDMASLLGISPSRVSEIVRADKTRGGV